MALISLDPSTWSDARFACLQESMRWSRAHTLGVVCLLWAATRVSRQQTFAEDELLRLIAGPQPLRRGTLQALLAAGYVTREGQAYTICDNVTWYELSEKRRKSGRVGGIGRRARSAVRLAPSADAPANDSPPVAAAAAPAPAKRPRGRPRKHPVGKTPAQEANAAAWAAYVEAYERRYQVEPLRNARVNGVIAQLVQRVGGEVAPEVLRFFLRHQDSHYLARQHDITLALRDAEALHTQWRRGQAVTRADVRACEGESRLEAQLQRISAMAP